MNPMFKSETKNTVNYRWILSDSVVVYAIIKKADNSLIVEGHCMDNPSFIIKNEEDLDEFWIISGVECDDLIAIWEFLQNELL